MNESRKHYIDFVSLLLQKQKSHDIFVLIYATHSPPPGWGWGWGWDGGGVGGMGGGGIWYSHYGDVIMGMVASQINSLTIVYSIVYSDADQRKQQSSASLAFVQGIHRGPVNSPHKWPVTRKMFPFDDVIKSIIRYYNELWLLYDTYIYYRTASLLV